MTVASRFAGIQMLESAMNYLWRTYGGEAAQGVADAYGICVDLARELYAEIPTGRMAAA